MTFFISPQLITSYCHKSFIWEHPCNDLKQGFRALILGDYFDAKIFLETAREAEKHEYTEYANYWLPLVKSSLPEWVENLDRLSPSDSIFPALRIFKSALDKGELTYTAPCIAKKIHLLSKEREEGYKNSRFGFIFELFSKIRNWWAFGAFKSSSALVEIWQKSFPVDLDHDSALMLELLNGDWETVDDTSDLLFEECGEIEDDNTDELSFHDCAETIEVEDDTDELSFYDCVESIEDGERSSHANREEAATVAETSSPQINGLSALTPNEQMLETFRSFWSNPADGEKIAEIWSLIFKDADIVNWEHNSNNGQCTIEMKNTLTGAFDFTDLYVIALPTTITFSLLEQEGKKIIDFSSQNLLVKPTGYTPSIYLQKIEYLNVSKIEIQIYSCMISKSQTISRNECISLWKENVTWS